MTSFGRTEPKDDASSKPAVASLVRKLPEVPEVPEDVRVVTEDNTKSIAAVVPEELTNPEKPEKPEVPDWETQISTGNKSSPGAGKLARRGNTGMSI